MTVDAAMDEAWEWYQEAIIPRGASLIGAGAKLLEESKEAFDEIANGYALGGIEQIDVDLFRKELADVAIVLTTLTRMTETDLASEIRSKLVELRGRDWGTPNSQGVIRHVQFRETGTL